MGVLGPALVLGALTGLIYALSGAGLVVIYRSSAVINFAHGDVAAVGLFVALALSKAGAPYWEVAVCTVVVAAAAGLAVGVLLSLPIARKWSVLEVGLATVGISFLIQGILEQTSGGEAHAFPGISDHVAVRLGDVGLTVSDLTTAAISLLAFLGLGLWFKFSTIGIAMRSASDNADAARWLGVPALRLRLVSWLVAGALAGLAGLFVAPLYSLSPTSMGTVVLFGFAAVVMGGFESIGGALLAGLIIGIVTNLTAAYIAVSLITPVMFLLMLLMLVFRPSGLLGRRPVVRV